MVDDGPRPLLHPAVTCIELLSFYDCNIYGSLCPTGNRGCHGASQCYIREAQGEQWNSSSMRRNRIDLHFQNALCAIWKRLVP